jgi:hypothetical protein
MTTFEVTQKNTIARAQPSRKRNANSACRFASESELIALTTNWPSRRLVEIWNGLPGVTPVGRFTSRRIAARRIWREIISQDFPQTDVPAPPTKGQRILALLVRPSGATLAEIMATTGWQPHSVRGFISAQIRKRMGYNVQSFGRNGVRVYRILLCPRPRKWAPNRPGPMLKNRSAAREI